MANPTATVRRLRSALVVRHVSAIVDVRRRQMPLSEIWKEFNSTACKCGRAKLARQSFCRWCFASLKPDVRNALYKNFGEGYEAAYTAACGKLGLTSAASGDAKATT
jgi:hypothetical protein